MGEGASIIEITGLCKRFGDVQAVRGVDLEVAPGEVLVVVGPSGSGKSTVLRCINGLEEATAGTIVVDGHHVTGRKPDLDAVRAEVGMVFQQFNLFPHLTVLGNLVLAQRLVRGRSKVDAEAEAMRQLVRVGIPEKAGVRPGKLSGGQQQRVAIARALAMHPRIMLFDEPTSALDPEMVKEVLDVMLGLAGGGMTMVVVSHELGFVRAAADRVVFMDEGLVVEQGPPEVVLSTPRHDRTARFVQQVLGL